MAASEEVIRIVSGEVRIELAPGTPALRVAEIVHALGAAPC
ncbi:transposase IS3/family protein [Rhodobacterales bacterium Y4I]|nr:transposase IS3/family protein [Rhodobacterales bacterium Y4I]